MFSFSFLFHLAKCACIVDCGNVVLLTERRGLFSDMVQEQWDPLSQKQCSRLGFLLSSLVDECPTLVPSSRSVKRLLEAIRQRVQESIDEDLFVPIYSKQFV